MKKLRNAIAAFLAVLCMLSSFTVCTLGADAEGAETVYATTSTSVAQGAYAYCYVYLDDLTDLASMTVSVYYDTEKITVTNSYNRVACELYDSSSKDGCLQFSYVFDGEGSAAKTNLFYFQYRVNGTAEAGQTFFDIVISDAHGKDLGAMDIVGSRCAFRITETAAAGKSCTASASSTVSTAVKEEFSITYRLSSYQIASGAFTVQYDPELFELVEVTNGHLLDNKAVDVNAGLDGEVAVSFVGTAYNNYQYDLVTVTFRTLKNVAQSATVKLNVTELYDLDLNPISCSGYQTKVNVAFDESYAEDSAAMLLSADYDEKTGKVMLSINLEKGSQLGAGDFVLRFDPAVLSYASSVKGFAPSLFYVNENHAADGVLKFSIVSTTPIVEGQTVLTVIFDVVDPTAEQTAGFEISGSGLVDAMTNAILLNFINTECLIPARVLPGDADGTGAITNADALAIFRYIYDAATYPLAAPAAADVDGNGAVTNADVLAIFRYIYDPVAYPLG